MKSRGMDISNQFGRIIEKASMEQLLTKDEITLLLSVKDEKNLKRLCETARMLRRKYFGNTVFLYGFVYFSTYCRNDCIFCINRFSNQSVHRYRKSKTAILETCSHLEKSGAHCIDLTMGEDPLFYQSDEGFFRLRKIVKEIKQKVNLSLMISPGAVPESVLTDLIEDGVDWYACYQESHNLNLFQRLRPNQDYEYRLNLKYHARALGLLIEEGILLGVGESIKDISESLLEMRRMEAHQIRVMRLIPHNRALLYTKPRSLRKTELIIIAVMRLLFPDRLIPASLDIDGIRGLKMRLDAGANVITSIVPPHMGFSGVAQPTLGINKGDRSVKSVALVLDSCHLESASLKEYKSWVKNEKDEMSSRTTKQVSPIG
jgi:methylornithine synthase